MRGIHWEHSIFTSREKLTMPWLTQNDKVYKKLKAKKHEPHEQLGLPDNYELTFITKTNCDKVILPIFI